MTSIPGIDPIAYTYDTHGRVSTTTQGQRQWSSTYGQDGEIASVTDPAGRTTTYAHDQAGRLTSQTMPGGATLSYTYDQNGNPLSANNT